MFIINSINAVMYNKEASL